MKNYNVITTARTAMPRSKRLREAGSGQASSGGSTVVNTGGSAAACSCDGHSHANKAALDAISIDNDFYLWLKQKQEGADDSTQEKVRSGYADDAAHAADADTWMKHAFVDYIDQALRTTDPVQFAKVIAALVQSPDFSSGINLGKGWRIDSSGAAELDSLSLRRFLEVPELRYNRTSVEVGNKWNAPGGGLIESVVVDTDADGNELMTGTITLHLEDGESGTVAVDDICMGVFHSLTSGVNSDEDCDDSRGNFKFKGFFTTYFRVTEILNADSSVFKYSLRAVSDRWTETKHPCASMTFVGYGNFTDTNRQKSRYSTRSYERFLQGVNAWEISESMIAAQFGDLSNLSIHGLQMTGYSAYMNNLYMSGTIKQFEALPLRMEIDNDGMDAMAYGESMTVTCTVWKGFNELTDRVTKWKIERDSGDQIEDAAWNNSSKAQNFDGSITIEHGATYSDLGQIGVSTLFTFTAYMTDGTTTDYTLEI